MIYNSTMSKKQLKATMTIDYPDGSYCETNMKTGEERWFNKHGVPHRDDGPAVLTKTSQTFYKQQIWSI